MWIQNLMGNVIEGKLTEEECHLYMAPFPAWAWAVSGTATHHWCVFLCKRLQMLKKKGEMLKDEATEKHLPLLLLKNSEQVLSAWYCCYQPLSKAVGNALITQKIPSRFFSILLITVVTPVMGLDGYLITADRSAFFRGFTGCSIPAFSNCTSTLPKKLTSPHLFLATSHFNPLKVMLLTLTHIVIMLTTPASPKTTNLLFLSVHMIILPRDLIQIVSCFAGYADGTHIEVLQAQKWYFQSTASIFLVPHMKNNFFSYQTAKDSTCFSILKAWIWLIPIQSNQASLAKMLPRANCGTVNWHMLLHSETLNISIIFLIWICFKYAGE